MSDSPIHLAFEAGTLVLTGGTAGAARRAARRQVRRPGRRPPRRGPRLPRPRRAPPRREDRLQGRGARLRPRRPGRCASAATRSRTSARRVAAWWKGGGGRGVVVLPTGTGKTFVAILAIQHIGRPTLVVTPTIDLMSQWYGELRVAFDVPVGLLGGGYHDIQPLTVTTYDSAHIHLDRWGNRFGLLVFDECHHLPGPSYMAAALGAIAPYRLGLTATPERTDGQEALLDSLIGPIVYRREITELTGEFLANYHTERLYVELTPEEAATYQQARDHYRQFCSDRGFSMGGANGWNRFIQETSRSREGRAAFQAYREQRQLALAAPAKLELLERLLHLHRKDRTLIFTYDNATVYEIARRYLVPAITHQTKTKERKHILDGFQTGEYSVIVTSRVLNEGVDVPAANVGIVLSGTSTVTRTRPAAGPAAAQARRQAGDADRGRDARHRRGVHHGAAAAA